jgi:HD-GYP domain-containing protein (c-di-GMP phosphodiesterase class II)
MLGSAPLEGFVITGDQRAILYRVTLSRTEISVQMGRATGMYFHEFDSAGRAQEDLPAGWVEARKVTSILVDAATPKDGYTAEHAVEVARLSRLVGMEFGFNEEELEALVQGALLHDLGKLGVPDAILEKPAPLTEEEWATVKRHPEIGARMLEPIEPLSGAVPGWSGITTSARTESVIPMGSKGSRYRSLHA